jgi:hypothetical protein
MIEIPSIGLRWAPVVLAKPASFATSKLAGFDVVNPRGVTFAKAAGATFPMGQRKRRKDGR